MTSPCFPKRQDFLKFYKSGGGFQPFCYRDPFRTIIMVVDPLLKFLICSYSWPKSGMYWVTLIDWYSSGLPLMIAAALEITCISWNYGVKRFIYDIQCMIGHRPFLWQWWQFVWLIVTPSCIFLLIIAHFAFYSAVKYGGTTYPAWAETLGWLSAVFSILSIPVVAIYQILTHPRAKGTFLQRASALLKCDPDWGPNDPNIRYVYRRQNLLKKDEIEEKKSPEELTTCCKRTGNGSEASSIEELDLPPVYGSS